MSQGGRASWWAGRRAPGCAWRAVCGVRFDSRGGGRLQLLRRPPQPCSCPALQPPHRGAPAGRVCQSHSWRLPGAEWRHQPRGQGAGRGGQPVGGAGRVVAAVAAPCVALARRGGRQQQLCSLPPNTLLHSFSACLQGQRPSMPCAVPVPLSPPCSSSSSWPSLAASTQSTSSATAQTGGQAGREAGGVGGRQQARRQAGRGGGRQAGAQAGRQRGGSGSCWQTASCWSTLASSHAPTTVLRPACLPAAALRPHLAPKLRPPHCLQLFAICRLAAGRPQSASCGSWAPPS